MAGLQGCELNSIDKHLRISPLKPCDGNERRNSQAMRMMDWRIQGPRFLRMESEDRPRLRPRRDCIDYNDQVRTLKIFLTTDSFRLRSRQTDRWREEMRAQFLDYGMSNRVIPHQWISNAEDGDSSFHFGRENVSWQFFPYPLFSGIDSRHQNMSGISLVPSMKAR